MNSKCAEPASLNLQTIEGEEVKEVEEVEEVVEVIEISSDNSDESEGDLVSSILDAEIGDYPSDEEDDHADDDHAEEVEDEEPEREVFYWGFDPYVK